MTKISGFFILSALFLFVSCSLGNTVNDKPQLFEIRKGEASGQVARNLKDAGIIKSTGSFLFNAKIAGKASRFKYGVYQIESQESYGSVLKKFATGQTYTISVTIPEGSTMFQVAEILERRGVAKKDTMLALFRNGSLLKTFGLPESPSLEGYLYPDTYFIPLGYSEQKIVALFLNHFKEVVGEKVLDKAKEKGIPMARLLALASIVEREAKQEFEKPIIAGVYQKRIQIGMKLQADPTLIYALELAGIYKGDIKFSHFTYDSPYNTYKYYGLPPGPIASPGKTAILAALYPAEVDYLYFVAKSDGTHYFSKTLSEHNQAVYQFQKLPAIERRRQGK